MTSSITAQSHKSPETLEHEIDQQRANISNIVDALESKLTPGQLFDQALAYTRGNGGEFFQNLGTTVKNNPVPTVLAGLSLAWLAMNQNRPIAPRRVNEGPSLMDRASAAASKVGQVVDSAKEQLRGAADSVTTRASAVKDSVTSSASSVKNSVASGASSVKDKATTWRDGASDRLSQGSERLNHGAHDLTHQAKTTGVQVKGQFEHLLQEQPLVLAAVGLALGAAFGAALPSTRHENRLLGKTSDRLTEQVKSKAREVKETVKSEAGAAVEQVQGNDSDAGSTSKGNASGNGYDGAAHVGRPNTGANTDLSRGLGTHH